MFLLPAKSKHTCIRMQDGDGGKKKKKKKTKHIKNADDAMEEDGMLTTCACMTSRAWPFMHRRMPLFLAMEALYAVAREGQTTQQERHEQHDNNRSNPGQRI